MLKTAHLCGIIKYKKGRGDKIFMKLKHIPNILSVIRIFMIPVFIYLFFEYYETLYLALIVFLLAGLTDIIDGYLARRNNWITNVGKLLDPLADKLLQCTVIICLTIKGIAPYWCGIIFILKELFMMCGALVTLKKIKFVVKSNWYGKATTAIFYLVVFMIFLFKENLNGITMTILLAIAIASAIFSMIMYIIDILHINKEMKK